MIDLHSHTLHSDGQRSPAELLAEAADRGLTVLALTDHDTVSGIADAISETGFTATVKTRAGSDGRKGGGVEPAARPTTSSGPSAHYDPRMGSVCEMTCAARIPYKEADLVPQPGAKFGDLTRCPVSGVVFKVGKQSPHVSHAGKQYFVCCRTCAAKFQANPEHFVG